MAPERGSALLVTLAFGLALAALSTLAVAIAADAVHRVRLRRDVLCARYAAVSLLAAGTGAYGARAARSHLDRNVSRVRYRLVAKGTHRCVAEATAWCGEARRTLERTVDSRMCR